MPGKKRYPIGRVLRTVDLFEEDAGLLTKLSIKSGKREAEIIVNALVLELKKVGLLPQKFNTGDLSRIGCGIQYPFGKNPLSWDLFLPVRIDDALRALSYQRRCSKGEIIQKAVNFFLKKEDILKKK